MAKNNHKPRLGCAVIVQHSGQVLLGVRQKKGSKGKVVCPGGQVKPFESLYQAGEREVFEETGIRVLVNDTVGVTEIINEEDNEHRVLVYVTAAPVSYPSEPQPFDSTEMAGNRWVPTEELSQCDLSDVTRWALDKVGLLS